MIKKNVIKVIFVVFMVISIIIITLFLQNKNMILLRIGTQKEQEESKTVEITSEIKNIDKNYMYYLIKFKEENSGISKIITPEGVEINANNRTTVALDWNAKFDEEYEFTIVNGAGETFIKTLDTKEDTKGLLSYIEDINESGINVISVIAQKHFEKIDYNLNTIVYNGNLVLDGVTQVAGSTLSNNVYEFGNIVTDVATVTKDAQNTVLLKVNGDLTINEGVTLTSVVSKAGYGGPKGLIVYCTGKITNNGTITMTARGAKAQGENVYLYQNADTTYEYIPKSGGTGGNKSVIANNNYYVTGQAGTNGTLRGTGGGGAGGLSGLHRSWYIRSR